MTHTAQKIKINNTELFIKKAISIHGDRYGYGNSVFVNTSAKLLVSCYIHGDFLVTPGNHLYNKQGCKQCYIESKYITLGEFIERAIAIHGNFYDYFKSIYTGTHNKLIIICPIHGEFSVTPHHHLQGQGCYKCGRLNIIESNRDTLESFISKARKVHGNKFDYSKFTYINSWTKGIIICPVHGEFEQTSNDHLSGQGCKKCSNIKLSILYKSTLEEFIAKAIAIHGNKFDYSKAVYINSWTKITIICLVDDHGEFEQTPNGHLSGHGCPTCNRSKGELAIEDILNKHNIESKQEYKLPNQEKLLDRACTFEYDFYLPELNILIEFHGGQHYFSVKHFGGEEAFNIRKRNDGLKRDLAKMANIPLIEFNYLQLKYLTKEQFEELVIRQISKFKKIK